MTYDFNRLPDRRNTNSYKWDQSEKLFGNPNVLPLWVADMDFDSPPAIKDALIKRAAQGVYGYTIKPDSYVDAIVNWFTRRHGWALKPEWLCDSPGIVTSLSLAVDLFSEPGSKVILQSPVYYPFYEVIKMNGREVAKNPLLLQNGRYEMDFDHLESLMKDGAKLMLLCSPHNPGGRVWEKDVLQRLGELCLKYGVIIVSDEIHCDLTYEGHPHTPIASLSDDIAQITLTCLAATKTFNIPGLHSSFMAIPNPQLKRKFEQRIKTFSLHMMNYFVPYAIEAAYNESEGWLDELRVYLKGNVEYALSYLEEHLPEVVPMRPEGTYLLWVDCRGLGRDIDGLKKLMYQEAEVAFNEGSVFGTEGEGYLRINLACPRSVLEEGLRRFCEAAKK
ncbi:MalY/PatB family protein [Marinicrinis lubricantis]|uniref:cysteine-S-conjugate beta-lyase n=1 Tax=Marinicrinis lubricantis TaxID=2086470 RepID=A0ABW1IP04_9BACL